MTLNDELKELKETIINLLNIMENEFGIKGLVLAFLLALFIGIIYEAWK